MDEFRHVAGMAQAQGIDFEVLSPAEAQALYPFLELHDLEGALWDPLDGDIDPSQLTQAYAKGARDLGARVKRFTKVTGLARLDSGEWRVTTDKGDIVCEHRGQRRRLSRGRGDGAGRAQSCPSSPCRTSISSPRPSGAGGRDDKLPLLRDPDTSYYLRQERDGLILGPYEAKATRALAWTAFPTKFANQLWPDDLDRLEMVHRRGHGARADPRHGRRAEGDQRADPLFAGRQPLYRPGAWPAEFLPMLLLLLRHRAIGRRGPADGGMDRPRRAGVGHLGLRPPALHRLRDHKLHHRAKAIELYRHEYAIGFPAEEWPAGRPA